MIVDEIYYKNIYKGNPTSDFDKLNIASQSIIEYMTLKEASSLLNSSFLVNIKNAICTEIEYLSMNSGLKALQGNDTSNMQSESIGSYSYVKKAKNEDIKYIKGIPISPMVEIILLPTGILYCGVQHVE